MTLVEAIARTGDLIRQLQQCANMPEVETETRSALGSLESQVRALIDKEFSRRLRQSARAPWGPAESALPTQLPVSPARRRPNLPGHGT